MKMINHNEWRMNRLIIYKYDNPRINTETPLLLDLVHNTCKLWIFNYEIIR